MAELTQQQKDLIAARDRLVGAAPAIVGQEEAAPGYEQPQTVDELAKAMQPKGPPRTIALTPEEEQAVADAAAEVASEEAGQKSFTEAGGAPAMFGEFSRSMGEGVATMADMPEMAGVGIANIWNRIKGNPLDNPKMPVNKFYNKNLPPDPNFPGARSWGNVAGPVLVTGPFGAAEATIPGLLARTAVTTAGVKGGGEVGGDIGEHFFGEPGRTYGGIAGSAIGGGVVQPLTQWAGYRGINRMLADPGDEFVAGSSASKLAAALRQGIPASVGLVGNRFARLVEDLVANIPGASGPPSRARRAQYEAYDRVARENAARIDPRGRAPVGEISEGSLGQQANQVADTAYEASIQPALNRLYEHPRYGLHTQTDPVTGQVILPRATPSPPTTQRTTLDAARNNPETNQYYQGPTLTEQENALRISSNLVVDHAYELALDAREANIRNNQGLHPQQQAVLLQQIAEERAANRAPSFQSERTARQHDARTLEGVPNDRELLAASRRARDEDMRNTAIDAGIDPRFYDDVDAWASNLLGEKVTISKLLSDRFGNAPAEEGSLFTTMFGNSGIRNLDQMQTLIRHAPGPLREMLARRYEQMTRGPAAGTPHPSPETFNPQEAVNWWDKQNDPVMREGYTGHSREAEQGVADLQTVLRGELGRPKRAVPGKGGNTLGSPGVFTGLLSALLGGGAAALSGGAASILGGPLMAASAGVPAVMRFIGNRMVDPGFTQRVVHPPGLGDIFSQPNLARILSSAIAGGINDRKPYSGVAMTNGQMTDKLKENGYTDDDLAGLDMGQKMELIKTLQAGAP